MSFDKIKQYPEQISTAFKRFPIAIGFLTFMTLLIIGAFQLSYRNPFLLEHYYKAISGMFIFSFLSVLTNVLLVFYQERYKKIHAGIILAIHGVIALLAYMLVSYSFQRANLYFSATLFTLLFSILLIPSFKEKNDIFLWNFLGKVIKAIFKSLIITGLFLGAIALLMFSFITLFELDMEKFFFNYVMEICWSFIAPVLALAGMPNLKDLEQEKPLNKFISGAIHFLFIPVLIVYLVIIYAFLARSLTSGIHFEKLLFLNVTIASVATILISIFLYPAHVQQKKSADKRLLRILPIVIFPLLPPAIYDVLSQRFDALDSIPYVYLIVLSFWLVPTTAILFISKIQKKIWWIMASLCVTNLIISFGPLNVYNLRDFILIQYSEIQAASSQSDQYIDENACTFEKDESKDYYYQSESEAPIIIPPNRKSLQRLNYQTIPDSLTSVRNDTLVFGINYSDSLMENFTIPLAAINTPQDVDSDTLSPLQVDNGTATLVLHRINLHVYSEAESSKERLTLTGYLFLK